MLPEERYKRLIEYLEENGLIKLDQLTALFDISIETARRDLNHLEKAGLIKKIYGGATLQKKELHEIASSERMLKNINEKKAIGRKCAEYINNGDSIMLEVGTTTLQVAKALKGKKDLTIVTNSIQIVNELLDTDFQLYIIGGKIRHDEGSISGAVSMFELDNFNIRKAILSVGGITLENGFSDFNIEEALVRKKVIQQSEEVFIASDSSKFGRDVIAHIAPLDAADLIITDSGIDRNMLHKLEQANVKVVVADPINE